MIQLCRKCGKAMKAYADGQEYHPLCAPDDAVIPGTEETYGDAAIREEITDIIKWRNNSSTRSQQVALGCSEAGDPCTRKVAMTMANMQQTNYGSDPWPAIVGTSIHTWFENAVKAYQQVHGDQGWLTELEVLASAWLPGHIDLYRPGLVLDLKNPSTSNFNKMKKNGIGDTYFTQVQLYGLGIERSGRPVNRVGVIMLPRDGHLRKMWVKTFPYDRAFAHKALQRLVDLGKKLHELDIRNHPERWSQIPAVPNYVLCGFCPFYRGGNTPADGTGCPGKNVSDDQVENLFN